MIDFITITLLTVPTISTLILIMVVILQGIEIRKLMEEKDYLRKLK